VIVHKGCGGEIVLRRSRIAQLAASALVSPLGFTRQFIKFWGDPYPRRRQQQQAIDVDLTLSFVTALIKAGGKTPSAKTLATGLEKSNLPLNERNVKALASPFSLCILTAQSPAAAADQMIGNSVALQECEQRYKKFRPMVVLAAEQAMRKSNLGATFRLFFGAALSMFDFVTGVLMIRDYFQQSDQGRRAWALLGMLLANLAINLLVSYWQNRKKGWKAVGKDWLLVLSYLKPSVDAWKVASGGAHDESLRTSTRWLMRRWR